MLSPEWLNDRDIVIASVTQDTSKLALASEALKKDREVVLEAVKVDQNGDVFRMIGDELKNDREIVLEGVRNYGYTLSFVTEDNLKNDKEIVLTAVKQIGSALRMHRMN